MLQPLCPIERPGTHRTGGWVGPGASLESLEYLASTEIRFPDRAAHSSFVQIIQLIQSSLVQWSAACRSLTPGGPQGYFRGPQISHNFAEGLAFPASTWSCCCCDSVYSCSELQCLLVNIYFFNLCSLKNKTIDIWEVGRSVKFSEVQNTQARRFDTTGLVQWLNLHHWLSQYSD